MVARPAGQLPPAQSKSARVDKLERIPFGERWVPDAWEFFHVPGGFGLLLADVTNAKKALRILRDAKIPATFPHLVVRAVGLTFARYPDAVQIVCNYQRLSPAALDVGLSMAGQTALAPVVMIPAVDQKPLSVLVPTIIEAVDIAAEKEARDLATLHKFAIPFRWFRRWILGGLHRNLKWRTRICGHFQVSCLPNTDVVVPLTFYSNAILGVGAVRDRVVAIDGQPVVRPTVWLSGVADHAATDGMRGGDGLLAIKYFLEGEELVHEAREAAALARERLLAPAEPPPAAGPGEGATSG
jgi:hypothetical protein